MKPLEDFTMTRRGLMQAAGAGLSLLSEAAERAAPGMMGVKFKPVETVRVGVIGVGGRGTSMLKNLLAIERLEVLAVCDIVPEKTQHARDLAEKAGQKAPAAYHAGEHDFENLCRRDDLDFVYIATPWNWHVPMAVAAMKGGKHAGVEVPAATTVEECWTLVNTSEKTRRHCLIMENCCYGYNELLVLNMARAGLFGDLLSGEAAYLHDLRGELFGNKGEGLWRRAYHTTLNGNLYPTHGLGPVASYMDIERGDRFEYLVSMSTKQAGLEAYRAEKIPRSDAKWSEKYKCGDLNTSLIRTAKGRTILLEHDVVNARPYDRLNMIEGTKGIFRDYPARVYLDGQEGGEQYTGLERFEAEYAHPLWKREGELAKKLGGHGGMDFLMLYRLAECMREGLAPDIDVYDAASWSVAGPLSEASVARGSAPTPFPDFTRGGWREKRERNF